MVMLVSMSDFNGWHGPLVPKKILFNFKGTELNLWPTGAPGIHIPLNTKKAVNNF
jgi:hypothetical protein